jgi:hypothetical protein
MKNKFKVGDIVISKYGKYPLEVKSIPSNDWQSWELVYLHNKQKKYVPYYNIRENYHLYETPENTETMNNDILYSFTLNGESRCRYGIHIGTNSQNKFIIEERGSGLIHILDKDQLEEVLPFTFSAKICGTEYHYIGNPDTVKVGDFLLCTAGNYPSVAVVTKVNTKQKGALKFKGAKIVTEPI